MNALKISLLIIAYTAGIISISLQVICYRKEIEYKETIAFMVSFLLLVISITVLEFKFLTGAIPEEIYQDAFFFLCLLLALTTPLNIHKERMIKKKKLRNKIVLLISLILFVFMVAGVPLGFKEIVRQIIITWLYVSIIYSLLMVASTKPELSILYREKTEKKMSWVILVFFVLFIATELFNKSYKFLPDTLFDGSIIISLIFIILALEKMIDDFKRLSIFDRDNRYSADKLSLYNITQRESEVITLLIKGTSYKEIAAKLFISMPTVKTHVSNIYQKMNINNKIELINLVSENQS